MARKLPQNHGNAKCFCGTRQSRNHASLFPCASGTPGESGWPGQTNGGSTANLSNGANQDSFSPGPTALPWAEQPCTTLCGDSTWQESAAASGPSLRKRSESLSSVGILLSEGSGSRARAPPRVPRRSNSRLSRREASLLVLSKKGSSFAIARISFCVSNHSSSSLSAGMSAYRP